MKKLSVFTFAAIFSIFAISCNNGENKDKEDEKTPKKETKAQIVDLESFNQAYETLEFETCDEFETAIGHFSEVYFSTLDEAVEGDEDAIAEFKKLHDMKDPLKEQAEKLNDNCPELMSELGDTYEKEYEAHQDDINQVIAPEESQSEEELTDIGEEKNSESGEPQITKKDEKKQTLQFKENKLNIDDNENNTDEEDQDIQM